MVTSLVTLFLTFSIIAGQMIKIPIGTHGGVTMLDITIMVLVLVGAFKLKMHAKLPPKYIMAASVFILIALLSLLFTPLHLTFLEYFTALSYTTRFLLYILLGWLIYSKAFPNLNIRQVLMLSGAGLAILGLLQFLILPDLGFTTINGWDPHYFRTVSTFLDPNFAGAFFVLTLILIMSLRGGSLRPTWQSKSVSSQTSLILLFILIYVALLTTFSRSSYLMFLVSGTILAFLRKSTKLFLTTIILFLILLLGFQIYVQLVASPRNIDRAQSASFRFNTWEQGAILFQKFPIVGVGFNAYRYGLREFNLGDEQFLKSHGASSNDSSLLFVTSTTGIVGLTAYLIFLMSLFKYSYPKNLVLGSAIGGLLIHSIFSNSLFYPPILSWIILTSVIPKK